MNTLNDNFEIDIDDILNADTIESKKPVTQEFAELPTANTQTNEAVKTENKQFSEADDFKNNILEFATEYVAYEAELKNVRADFKELRKKYAEMGVPVSIVTKIVKKMAKDFKASPYDVKHEQEIETLLLRNNDIKQSVMNVFGTNEK